MINTERNLNPILITGQEKCEFSLESILGDKMPNDELSMSYLRSILDWRVRWIQDGEQPPFDRNVLGHFIDKDPAITKKLNSQLRLIYRATQIPNGVSEGKPVVDQKARVVHGELRLGEAVEYIPRI